jgi:hypothetical protein
LDGADNDASLGLAQAQLISLRNLYFQVETALDFYGDAINTRTSAGMASQLRALDFLAHHAMAQALVPLGQTVPPVLTYVDRGLGASILRQGLRLWDRQSISPVSAIKITRHNLDQPTSAFHEAGHQVAYSLGWTEELASLFRMRLPGPANVSQIWAGWASEIAADAFALVTCGYAAVAALHDVLAGDDDFVFRFPFGDPHPITYLRILLGAQMAKSVYGSGPWDALAEAWEDAHPVDRASDDVRQLLEASLPLLPAVSELSLLKPMRAFRGRSLAEVVDPGRVSPRGLDELRANSGRALHTSHYLLRTEGVRLLALSGLRIATEPERAADLIEEQRCWMGALGDLSLAA